jgi:hypothetical protein
MAMFLQFGDDILDSRENQRVAGIQEDGAYSSGTHFSSFKAKHYTSRQWSVVGRQRLVVSHQGLLYDLQPAFVCLSLVTRPAAQSLWATGRHSSLLFLP